MVRVDACRCVSHCLRAAWRTSRNAVDDGVLSHRQGCEEGVGALGQLLARNWRRKQSDRELWHSYGVAVVRSIPFAFSLLDSIAMALFAPATIGSKVSPKSEVSVITTDKSQYQFLV